MIAQAPRGSDEEVRTAIDYLAKNLGETVP
jgi:hypothetical protein